MVSLSNAGYFLGRGGMLGVPLNSHENPNNLEIVRLMGRLFVVFFVCFGMFVLVEERSLISNLSKVFAGCFQERKWTVVFFAQNEAKVFRKLILPETHSEFTPKK